MQFKIPHKRNLLCAAVSLSLLPIAGTSMAQDEATVEEVIVTGSYIRRTEGFTQASTVIQYTAEDLEAEGTLNLGEVVQNMTFVQGDSSSITNTIQGTDSRSTTVDLRGLGGRATLTLLDGKRIASENVNAMIPTIAIQRLDIVADGASALYGSEAIAGVVNFVPYTSYDGFRIESYAEGDTRGDYDEHSVQMLWGEQIGELDIVLAGQFRQNSRLGWDERSVLANSGLTLSSNAPGNWYIPVRDEDGNYTGARSRGVDPNCTDGAMRTDYTPDVVANAFGQRRNNHCWFDYGDNRSYREPTETNQVFANVTWDYSDDLTLMFQGYHTRLAERTYSSTSNPGQSKIGDLPAARGELPGNPFRACKGGRFDPWNAGQCLNPDDALFGVDYNGDGLPDRGSADLNNDGLADAIVHPNGWIPLNEDVQARGLRPINKTHTTPAGHSPDMDNLSDNIQHVSRYTIQADFTVPFLEGWEGMAAYSHNYSNLEFMSNQNYDITYMIQGMNCDVVSDRSNCYSPFFIANPADNNSRHVMDAIAGRSVEVLQSQLDTIDLVFNGEIPLFGFELPGGPVGAAVGYQYRKNNFTNVPSEEEIAGVTWIGGYDREGVTNGDREVDSLFVEVAVPVLNNLEVEVAVRNETFSTGQEATTPKYGITYAPLDWLTLRATQGEAFVAPSLTSLFNPVTCGLGTITDPFIDFDGFTTTCGGGNPDLGNETSESTQLGFDLVFDNFDIHISWSQTDFQNRIIGFSAQDVVNADYENFKSATGHTSGYPSLDQLRAWIAHPASNKRIIRGDDLFALELCCRGSNNAEFVKVTAWDIQGNYSIGFDNIGDFRFNLQGTYIDEFLYQSKQTDPIRDGAGDYNYGISAVPEQPTFKANLRTSWTRGEHSVVSTFRYIDSMPWTPHPVRPGAPNPDFRFLNDFGGTYFPNNILDVGVKRWTQMDLAYTYRGLEMFDGEMAFTLGIRNVFDREAQRSPEFAGVIGGLQDPLGRVLTARVVYDF